jgi:hypothetical protein
MIMVALGGGGVGALGGLGELVRSARRLGRGWLGALGGFYDVG